MTSEAMYEALHAAYGKLAAKHSFKTIPTGTAVQLYRRRLPVEYGKLLTKDEIAAIARPGLVDFHGDVTGSSRWKKGRKKDKDRDEVKLRLDASHLNEEGKYLQACVWLASLFGVDVTKLTYEPKIPGFASRAALMRRCAAEAVSLTAKCPF